ncbi:MAG: hypothetical protein HY822_21595 [Acidobacteria bacterium]|nr:hypothetical protein [Acidobacteriota bacterium]
MTHRERVLTALRREPPDRVPRDLGATLATTLTAGAHRRLREHLGLPAGEEPPFFSRRSSTVLPDEAILQRFDVDARAVLLGGPELCPDRDLGGGSFADEWGITWSRPHEGHYLNTDGPFYRIEDPSPRLLDQFSAPDPADPGRFRGLRERARALHQGTDYAVVLGLGVGPVHQCQFLRGYGEWLEDLLARPAFAEGLLELAADFWIAVTTRALEEAADQVDLVMFGDDVGTQQATLMRPALYRSLVKPHHRRMIDAVKRFGKPVLYHTCGSVAPLIPDLIEIGVDALNPVQVTAAGMDPLRLKREFGRELAFWGAIDNQRLLPFGTPADVRAQVRQRIGELASGGGYVLSAGHNIQADVPPENVAALYEISGSRGSS